MGSGAFLVEACRQLGDVLVKAWHVHHQVPRFRPTRTRSCTPAAGCPALPVRRGQEPDGRGPGEVVALAGDAGEGPPVHVPRPRAALRRFAGRPDARADRALPLEGRAATAVLGAEHVLERLQAATRCRREILEAGDEVAFDLKQQKLTVADESLNLVRFAGNLSVAAFFAADKDRQRQERRESCCSTHRVPAHGQHELRPTAAEQALRAGDKGITPFHWEIEFPEVFGREEPGFDCIVGNPPFAGKNTI